MTPPQSAELLSDFDLHLFREGTHLRLYQKLGAQPFDGDGMAGTHFAVWAPNAQRVYLKGDFNEWSDSASPMSLLGDSGIWAAFVPEATTGMAYQYHVVSWHQAYRVNKTDPFAFRHEGPPRNAAIISDLEYEWSDGDWMQNRSSRNQLDAPISIYEVHCESWMRVPEEGNRWLTFRELAPKLADYARRMEFTHVQLLPVMEHPLLGPREYVITGHFATAARLGSPQDLMFLVDQMHQAGVGVILDWVPTHFPPGETGLAYFDGTQLYEHGAWPVHVPKDGEALPFDFTRPEVRSFLLSNAVYWLDMYHVDGLKIDSASPLIHLDAGRKSGEWVTNAYGGRENLDGIQFLRRCSSEVGRLYPDTLAIIEEQTGFPSVTKPVESGGLGFALKWDSNFAPAMLKYLSQDPLFRKSQHSLVARTAGQTEQFLLPLAHAELGKGCGSYLSRMFGDDWQKFANLRLLLGYQYTQPGKKVVFMGTEFGQWQDWNRVASLDWHLEESERHAAMQRWVRDLNRNYAHEPALHQSEFTPGAFEWVDPENAEWSVVSWLRRDRQRREVLLVVCNFTPVVRRNYIAGVRRPGRWRELMNSDAKEFGGSGQGNFGGVESVPFGIGGFPHSLALTLPPLGLVVLKHEP